MAGATGAAGAGNNAYCLDATTGTPCAVASVPLDLGQDVDQYYDIVAHGTRVYVASNRGAKIGCLDTVTKAPCAGWSFGTSVGSFNILRICDKTGVCRPSPRISPPPSLRTRLGSVRKWSRDRGPSRPPPAPLFSMGWE